MPVRLEPAGGSVIALILALAATCASSRGQEHAPSPLAALAARVKAAERLASVGNGEQARVDVGAAIARLLALPADTADAERAQVLRDAGALAYRLRALVPARAAWEFVRAQRERTLPPDDLELQNARGNVAWIGEQLGLVAEARALEEQIVAALERSQPPDHDALQMARANLGDTLLALGAADGALEQFRRVSDVRRAKLPAESPLRLRAELDLACGLVGTGALDEAARVLSAVLASASSSPPVALRASVDLALVQAARRDARAFHEAASLLARVLPAALARAETEFQRAELAPAVDALISCALGLGIAPESAELLELSARAVMPDPPAPCAVFRRVERSAITGEGRECSVLADERLGAFVFDSGRPVRWLDLGPIAAIRDATQRWHDAASGRSRDDERTRGEELARLVLTPLRQALPDPGQLTLVPDDVAWAIPFGALPAGMGRALDELAISVVDPTPRGGLRDGTGQGSLVFLEPDPAAESAAQCPGAAAAFASTGFGAPPISASPWRPSQPEQSCSGASASMPELRLRASRVSRLILALPAWSAPDDTPCPAIPRRVDARASLAAALVREDVVGGSPASALCGLGFAGYRREPDADARVPSAPTAADIGALELGCDLVLLASAPIRRDVRSRARDIEALSQAFHRAGVHEVAIPAWPVEPESVRSGLRRWLEEDRAGPRAVQAGLPSGGGPGGGGGWNAWVVTRPR